MSATKAMRSEACWACSGTEWQQVHRIGDYSYIACLTCGLAHLDPLPTEEHALELYGEAYFNAAAADGATGGYRDYAVDEELHRRNGRDRWEALDRVGVPPGPVLDIGCAHGYFLDEVRALGRPVVGVEPSAFARGAAERLLGQPVFEALADVPPDPVLAAVTFFQVLEHLVDPAAALAEAFARLVPGGVLAVETWDRGSLVARLSGSHWSQLTPPSVVTLLDRTSGRRLLTEAGFEVEQVRRTTKVVSVGLVAGLIGEKLPRAAPASNAVLHHPRLRSLGVRYGLGDIITLVARKP